MNDGDSEQPVSPEQAEEGQKCGPGCNCNCDSGGSGSRTKTIIALAIVIAASLVLANGLARNSKAKSQQNGSSFSVSGNAKGTAERTGASSEKSGTWGSRLKSIESLNEVASGKSAVFVYVPEKGKDLKKDVMKSVEAATKKLESRGTSAAFFALDDDSESYSQITSKWSAPCVLALAKGGGGLAVEGKISEDKLLGAMLAASRRSSCGSSGCGPGGCSPSPQSR